MSTVSYAYDNAPAPSGGQATPALLLGKLRAYKRRYYLNRLLRGALIALAGLAAGYLAVAGLEYLGHFGTGVRTALFYAALAAAAGVVGYYFAWPLWQLARLDAYMSDDDAARQIGAYFPEVADKLVNLLQLVRAGQQSALLAAAMQQKTERLAAVPFTRAVDVASSRRYVPWALGPLLVIGLLLIFLPKLLTEATQRLVQHSKVFIKPAPFTFRLASDSLQGLAGEPFTLKMVLEGDAVPDKVTLQYDTMHLLMHPVPSMPGAFTFTVDALQDETDIAFEAAGYTSAAYKLRGLHPPQLVNLHMRLVPPAYTGKKPETVLGGDISTPMGTVVTWEMEAPYAKGLSFTLPDKTQAKAEASGDGFAYKHRLLVGGEYQISLDGTQTRQRAPSTFRADMIPDLPPAVEVISKADSLEATQLWLAGTLQDDYGISSAQVLYRTGTAEGVGKLPFKTLPISLTSRNRLQTYLKLVNLEAIGIQAGQTAELAVRVHDNDGVHGPKASTSRIIRIAAPTERELVAQQDKRADQAAQKMQSASAQAERLKAELEQNRQKLMGKKSMGFQEKKNLEQLVERQKELAQQLEQLKQEAQRLERDQEKTTAQSAEIKEKSEQLQKLLDDLLDEDTKKLYDELQKLLDEKTQTDEARDLLEKLQQKEQNLAKELDRALELFKKLAVEKKLEQNIAQLEEQAKAQQDLAKDMQEAKDPKGAAKDEKSKEAKDAAKDKAEKEKQDLAQEQKEANDAFKQLEDDMKKLDGLNKELEQPGDMPKTGEDEKQIEQSQQEAGQEMQKPGGSSKKAGKSAQKAGQQMQQMAQKMRESQQSEEAEETEENADDLRQILENLLRLSKDQEEVARNLRGVNQLDPAYLALAQNQVKLREDAVLIEDSLYALAKRVFQIQTFVTREVGAMRQYMDEAADAIKRRQPDQGAGKGQLAMTSMNNLALMLSDVLKQMQEQMQQQQGQSGGGGKPKKGKGKPGQGSPSLSQLQQQLNKQMQQLQKSGKSGRGLSEELAKMAAQQEAIRRALARMEKANGAAGSGGPGGQKPGGKPGEKPGGEQPGGQGEKGKEGQGPAGLKSAMEQTERDLVNKRISDQTIKRQQEILTRLLEAEQATREREQDQKREARTAQETPPAVPPALSRYLAEKKRTQQSMDGNLPYLTRFYREANERYFRLIYR